MFSLINVTWGTLLLLYEVVQFRTIYGGTSVPVIQMLVVYALVLRDVPNPVTGQALRKFPILEPLSKVFRRIFSVKIAGLPQVTYTLHDVVLSLHNLVLSSVFLLQVLASHDEWNWGLIVVRCALVILLLFKQSSKHSLGKLVAINRLLDKRKSALGDRHVGQQLWDSLCMYIKCCFCTPWTSRARVPNVAGATSAAAADHSATAIAEPTGGNLESFLSGSANVGVEKVQLPPQLQTMDPLLQPCYVLLLGSPTLAAVVQLACFEGIVVVFLMVTPLLEALTSPRLALLYSPLQALLLVCGAYLQCTALVFLASYLSHRRTIALELRTAERAYTVTTGSGGAGSKNAGFLSWGAGYVVSEVAATLLSALDCDARLSCMPGSSWGSTGSKSISNSGQLSEVDAFAADAVGSSSTGCEAQPFTKAETLAGGRQTQQQQQQQGPHGGKHASPRGSSSGGGGGDANGKGGRNHSNHSISTSAATASAPPRISSINTPNLAASPSSKLVPFQPVSHLLVVCLQVVLAVAVAQAGLVLVGATDRKSGPGTALLALVGLGMVLLLRVRVPALCSRPSATRDDLAVEVEVALAVAAAASS